MGRLLLVVAVLGLFAMMVPDQAKADHRLRGGYSSFYGGYGAYGRPHVGGYGRVPGHGRVPSYGRMPGYGVPVYRPPVVHYGSPFPHHYPTFRGYPPYMGNPYGFQRSGISLHFGF